MSRHHQTGAGADARHRAAASASHVSDPEQRQGNDRVGGSSGHRLLIWVAIAFGIQAMLWTGWLVFAARHVVAEVPLANETTK
jgi:hypothetical protein